MIEVLTSAISVGHSTVCGTLAIGLLVVTGLAGGVYFQRQEARTQRDRALVSQSRFLADLANQRSAVGDQVTGALISAETLPDEAANLHRPFVAEALSALDNAIDTQRELAVLSGPSKITRARFAV